jgi:TRAP transporter TAXI family solute receptor
MTANSQYTKLVFQLIERFVSSLRNVQILSLKFNHFIVVFLLIQLYGPLPAMAQGGVQSESLGAPVKKFMTITTGTSWGNLAPVGSKICQLVNLNSAEHNVYCSVRKSSGSDMNLERILRNNVDFAIVGSDQAKRAVDGTFRPGVFGAFTKLRGVFSLFPEQFVAVANQKTEVTSFLDFKGKIIDAGEEGSSTSTFFRKIIKGYGIQDNQFKQVTHLQSKAMIDAFCSNKIDGFVELSGSPSPKILEVLNRCGGRFVLIDGGVIKFLADINPELVPSVIPAQRYPGINYEVPSIGTQAILITSEDTDLAVTKAVVESVAARLDQFQSASPVVSDVSLGKLLPRFDFMSVVPDAKKVLHD